MTGKPAGRKERMSTELKRELQLDLKLAASLKDVRGVRKSKWDIIRRRAGIAVLQ